MKLGDGYAVESLVTALDHIDEGLAHFDADLRLAAWNEAFERFAAGSQISVHAGMSYHECFPDSLLAGHEVGLYDPASPQRIFEYLNASGGWVRLNQRLTPCGGLMCHCANMAELKEKERNIQEIYAFFEQLIDFIPAQLVVKNSERRYVLANRAIFDVTGISRDKMLGKTAEDIYPPEVYIGLNETDSNALNNPGKIHEAINAVDFPKWGIRYLRKLSISTPMLNKEPHIISIVEDITERHNAEVAIENAMFDAQQANLAKSVFLATMSHEIRTPLNGVLGMAQAIAMDELSPTQRSRLEVLRQSGEALLSILNDVLDISKIEAGKLTLEEMAFDLGETLASAAQSYENLAQAKGLALVLDFAGGEGTYWGDCTRVRQILYNLIANAVKFTEQGSIRVTADYSDERLRLSVVDTGIGIPADKLDKLFIKFSQVDETMTRRFGGTGLGLSICKELAELMGGSIRAESVEGRGTSFFLDLPLKRVGEASPTVPAAAAPAVPEAQKLRVLAAEDNATNQLVLKALLEFADVQLEMVSDGAQAVEAWADQTWDVILMDVQMSVMDGLAATREIRRREAAERRPRTPIIALTANAMAHQIAQYIDVGMDGHVAKPIQAERLYEALAALEPVDPTVERSQESVA